MSKVKREGETSTDRVSPTVLHKVHAGMVPFPLLRVAGWCCMCHDSNITSGRQGNSWTTSCRSTIVLWRMGMWLPKQFDKHAFSCNHKVNLSNTLVIDTHPHAETCCMLESWHMQHQTATLNRGKGTMLLFSLFPFSDFLPLICFMNTCTSCDNINTCLPSCIYTSVPVSVN